MQKTNMPASMGAAVRRAWCVLLLLCLLPWCARSAQLEIGAGFAHASPRVNGVWYQQGFPYRLRLDPPVAELGVVQSLSSHAAIHVDAVWLGSYASDSLDTPVDGNYNRSSPTHCNGACLPLAHYVGRGSLGGVQALAERHTDGPWRLGVEGGLFEYHSAWRLDVANWYPATAKAGGYTIGPITPIHTSDSRWATGFVLGVTAAHGRWSAALRLYTDGAGFAYNHNGLWPPIWKRHIVLMIERRI